MVNTGCLEGLACPKCKSCGPLTISAKIFLTVTDDGIDDYGDSQWDSDSHCRCHACDYSTTVADFVVKEKTKKEKEEELGELSEDELDEMVHDIKGQEAADINNAGKEAQIEFILG